MSESGRIFFHFCRSLAVFRVGFKDVVRALALPVAIGVASALWVDELSSTIVRLTVFALLSIAFVLGALRLHCLVLLGPDSIGLGTTRDKRRRAHRYSRSVLIVVGIATIFTLPLVLLAANDPEAPNNAFQASMVFYALVFFWSYVFVRFSMLFVAHAVDEPLSLKLSWRVTGQFSGLVIYLTALIPLLVLLDSMVTEQLLILANCSQICASLANKLAFTASFSLVIVSLTLAYETMRDNSPFYMRNNSGESQHIDVR